MIMALPKYGHRENISFCEGHKGYGEANDHRLGWSNLGLTEPLTKENKLPNMRSPVKRVSEAKDTSKISEMKRSRRI